MARADRGKRSVGSYIAGLLDFRCPNCGARTVRTLMWRCEKCGYPSRRNLRCPGCGQATARTRDWACQWCGYPLLSDLYQEAVSPPQTEELLIAAIRAGTPAAIPESPAAEGATGSAAGEDVPPVDPQTPPKAPRRRRPGTPVVSDEISLTVEDLSNDFRADPGAAEARYRGQIMKVKGDVIEAQAAEGDAAPVIVLGSGIPDAALRAKCSFGREQAALVRRVKVGKALTVLGRYEGHQEEEVRLADCLPVG